MSNHKKGISVAEHFKVCVCVYNLFSCYVIKSVVGEHGYFSEKKLLCNIHKRHRNLFNETLL